jgi:uncharacterized glyoxalase superfamily protein PhnB
MQTIIPILRYDDARAAIDWLCENFGFKEEFSVPPSGEFVRHAQLSLGENRIMLGSCGGDGLKTPRTLGVSTQALCVYVPDVDEHYRRALASGARPLSPPQDTDFGSRSSSK